jgi:hypothetical protein
LLFIVAAVWVFCGVAAAQSRSDHQLREAVDHFLAVCGAEASTLEEAGAVLLAQRNDYVLANDDAYRQTLARSLHPGERFQPGLQRAYFPNSRGATVIVEFRPLSFGFGLFAALYANGAETLEARLRERLGPPQHEQISAAGARELTFAREDARLPAPEIFLRTSPGRTARIVCGMPTPPASELSVEQATAQLVDEMWRVCGLYADSIDDAARVVGLLRGRYRVPSASLNDVLHEGPGALMPNEEYGIEIAEKRFFVRDISDGVVLLELVDERRNGETSILANFRMITLDAEALKRAIAARFGPRDTVSLNEALEHLGFSGPPREVELYTFGAFAPIEPQSRHLVALFSTGLSGPTHTINCNLRRFPAE